MDEVLALPSDNAARLALRTQQVIANETRVANVADPLGGSWFVEDLTAEMERQGEAVFDHLDRLGDGSLLEGVFRAIESGWFQGEIAEAAYELERKLNDGRHLVVGVNTATQGGDQQPEILRIGPEVEETQLKRLARAKGDRDDAAVDAALARVRADAAEPDVNLMPGLVEAVTTHATVGEVVGALADVFGRYREDPVI
jgi:methylmalonyl-CoA mutase N-terminal domain/subunit